MMISLVTDSTYRNEVVAKGVPRISGTVQGFMENLFDGDIGKRGERLVGAMAGLVFIIIFTNAPKLSILVKFFTRIFTTLIMILGLGMITNAIWELHENLSIFLTPCVNQKLIKSGIFRLVRHPIYGGVWLFVLGYSLAQEQVYKIVLTIGLFVVLLTAAEIEEDLLEKKHPKEYPVYASNKHVLIPFLY